jgi:hypothetical protein
MRAGVLAGSGVHAFRERDHVVKQGIMVPGPNVTALIVANEPRSGKSCAMVCVPADTIREETTP